MMNAKTWTVAHLQTEEPEASPYLMDEWDDATLPSTASFRLAKSPVTLLRDGGIPSELIISVDRQLPVMTRAVKKAWRAIRLLLFYFWRKGMSNSSECSTTNQPSLGVNGVLV